MKSCQETLTNTTSSSMLRTTRQSRVPRSHSFSKRLFHNNKKGKILFFFIFFWTVQSFIYFHYFRLAQRPRQWVQQLELFLTGKPQPQQQQQRQGVHQIIEQLFREVVPYQLLTIEQQQTPQQTQLQGLIEEVQRRLQGELVEELDQRRREQTKYNTQLRMFERLVEPQPQPQPDQTEPRPIDDATNPVETTASVTTNADGCRG